MALSLQLHRENVRNTTGDVNSLDVAITPSAAPSLESMSALVLPPVADFLGDLGTTQIFVSNVDSNPSTLRLLAKQYLDGQKRIEEAAALVDESIRKRSSKDCEESWQVMLQTNLGSANEDSAAFIALGA
jgi:hypothetical protein